ncbi:hypothetical protein NHF46_02145 [Arthrobacter alpinus]|nr:hypothetical protein [Arthrobacter alpinus]
MLPHTWQEARDVVWNAAEPLTAHPVPLSLAVGRILAADVFLWPPHAPLRLLGHGWVGRCWQRPVDSGRAGKPAVPGQAVPIVTGGLIPTGAKAVLRSESGELSKDDDGLPVLVLGDGARPGSRRTDNTSALPAKKHRNVNC